MTDFFHRKNKQTPSWDRLPSRSLSSSHLGAPLYGSTPPLLTQSLTGTVRSVQRSLSSGTELGGFMRRPGQEYPHNRQAYELLNICGKGATAKVWRARCKPLGELVAVKEVDLWAAGDNVESIIQEAQLLSQLRHPNIPSMLACFVGENDEEVPCLYMVMPYVVGGSVESAMNYGFSKGLEERVVAPIMLSVLHAVAYLHHHSIVHRDIKASNILLSHDVVMLGDFGIATKMKRNLRCPDRLGLVDFGAYLKRKSYVGTPIWMAPEAVSPESMDYCKCEYEPPSQKKSPVWDPDFWVPLAPSQSTAERQDEGDDDITLEHNFGHDMKADVYAFGITLMEMAMGKPPYHSMGFQPMVMSKLNHDPPQLPSHHEGRSFSPDMQEVVAMCLQTDPKDRPTAAKLLKHRFFKFIKEPRLAVEEVLACVPGPVKRLDSLNRRRMEAKRSGLDAGEMQYLGEDLSVNNVRSRDASQAVQSFGPKQAATLLHHMLSSAGVHKMNGRVSGGSADGSMSSPMSHTSILVSPTPSSRRLSFTKSKSFAKGDEWPHLPPAALNHAKAILFASGGRKGFGVQTSWGNGFVITNIGSADAPCWTGPVYVSLTGSKSVGIGENSRESIVLFRDTKFRDLLLDSRKFKLGDLKLIDAVEENLRPEDILTVLKENGSKWNGVAFRHYANAKLWNASASHVLVDSFSNEKVYNKVVEPSKIMQGKEAPPIEFRNGLIDVLILAQQGKFAKVSLTKTEHDSSDTSLSAHSSSGLEAACKPGRKSIQRVSAGSASTVEDTAYPASSHLHVVNDRLNQDLDSPFVPRSSFSYSGSPPSLAAVEEGAQSREDVQQTEQSNNMQRVLRDLPPLRGFNPIHRVSSEPAVHLALDQWESENGTPPPYEGLAQSYYSAIRVDGNGSAVSPLQPAGLPESHASSPIPLNRPTLPDGTRDAFHAISPPDAEDDTMANPFMEACSSSYPVSLDGSSPVVTPSNARGSGLGKPPKPGKPPPRAVSAKSAELRSLPTRT